MSGATLDGSSFMLADLTGATFNAPTSIQNAVFVDATLDNVKLPGAVAHGAVFTGASLEDAVFDHAQLGSGADSNLRHSDVRKRRRPWRQLRQRRGQRRRNSITPTCTQATRR